VLVDDLNIRVLNRKIGHLIRKLVLDPPATTNHGASNAETHQKTAYRCKPCLGTPVNDVPRHDMRRADSVGLTVCRADSVWFEDMRIACLKTSE
jgi:hypothetical protein